MFNLDYFEIIKDVVRNSRTLNECQLTYKANNTNSFNSRLQTLIDAID